MLPATGQPLSCLVLSCKSKLFPSVVPLTLLDNGLGFCGAFDFGQNVFD